MPRWCEWEGLTEGSRCVRCGYALKRDYAPVSPKRPCSGKPGLGDHTERLLSSLGITAERYKEAKRLFGLAPKCGCDQRKAWLNRVGAWWRG